MVNKKHPIILPILFSRIICNNFVQDNKYSLTQLIFSDILDLNVLVLLFLEISMGGPRNKVFVTAAAKYPICLNLQRSKQDDGRGVSILSAFFNLTNSIRRGS